MKIRAAMAIISCFVSCLFAVSTVADEIGFLSPIVGSNPEGAWIELKKPILEELAVLDPRELTKKVEAELCKTYDDLSESQVQSLPSIDTDPVHQKIDAALASAFEISDDLARLRDMLAREPIVSMRLPNEIKK